MFEVDPGVRVAPDEDGEEKSGERRREEHDDQPEQAAVADRDQRRVVRSERKSCSSVVTLNFKLSRMLISVVGLLLITFKVLICNVFKRKILD